MQYLHTEYYKALLKRNLKYTNGKIGGVYGVDCLMLKYTTEGELHTHCNAYQSPSREIDKKKTWKSHGVPKKLWIVKTVLNRKKVGGFTLTDWKHCHSKEDSVVTCNRNVD